MKNSFFVLILVSILNINFLNLSFSQEQFNFDVTEIEINEKGNKFKGLKRGTISTNNGVYIDADTFEYDKITNILVAFGNVTIKDTTNNLKIVSEDITFLRNEDKIFTKTRSKAFSNDIYIDADSLEYDKKLNTLNAKGNVQVKEKVKNLIINSDEITYYIDSEIFISKFKSEAIGEGLNIKADEFEYNNILNLINANKNVKIEDKINDIILLSENVTYLKNKEKIFTQGQTETFVESKYNFISKDTVLLRNEMQLSSAEKASLKDNDGSVYNFSNFDYLINQKILKGNDVKITTNFNKEKSDQFFFSSGIFNLNNKEFAGKDTKILLHKTIFDKEKEKFLELIEKTEINKMKNQNKIFENEPRLYGVSSEGNDSKTIIKKGVFTSCKKNDDCPAWSMKSTKITHDKEKRKLIYDNSILNLYNVPVFYFPKFFHPDPTVKRQSGFLRPQLNSSKTLGTSFYLPYYYVISENKDYTFKPQIFDSEIEMFQNEYRQVNKNSNFIADFGITSGYQSSLPGSKRNSIGHLFSKFDIDLNFEDYSKSKLNFYFESVTNDTFLKVFQNNLIKSSVKPSSTSTLNSGFKLILDHEDHNFDAGMQVYETLSGAESDRYQYEFPYYSYSTTLLNELADGTFNFSSSGSNVLNNTNVLKTSINNDLSFASLDYFSNIGFKNNYGMHFKNLNTVAENHDVYKSSFQSQLMSIFEAKSSFPLIRKSDNYDETISPTISFRLNPGQMKNVTSRGVNVDNIFSINRLGLSEAYEKGKSLTLGLDYRKDPLDNNSGKDLNNDGEISELEKVEKFFEIKLAGVLRDVEEDKISSSTTLNRKASNLFGSITNKMSDKVQFDYNFAIDNDLSTFESNEIDFKFSLNNLITNFSFSEKNGEMGDSNSISNSTLLKIDDNNYLTFETRRNRKISLTEYYDLVYEYKNDCLTAGFKYRKTYYSDRDAKPTEDLLLTLTLFPLVTLEQNVEQEFYKENDLFN
ncbi:organic solvent tolerance protein [Candidatus Pelagibacter sp.]|nr:organic solvent tolerance protein [Candidatus Pelagibacter sp.]